MRCGRERRMPRHQRERSLIATGWPVDRRRRAPHSPRPFMSEPAPAHSPPPAGLSFWQLIRQALRGEHHDYTSLGLNRSVIFLAVPMVLEMLMESLFAVADVFWVSRLGNV